MGIMTRFARLCRADIHGMMDQLEDKGLVLKQCLREMEESIAADQARLGRLRSGLEQLEDGREKYLREREKLEADVTAAVEKEKDAIARMLIRKLKTLDRHLEVMADQSNTLKKQTDALSAGLNARKQEYDQLKLRSETWLRSRENAKWEETVCRIMPQPACAQFSDEEVELELIRRKDAVRGGAS